MSRLVHHQSTAVGRGASDQSPLDDIRARTDDPERIACACRARALVLEREGCLVQAAQLRQLAHVAATEPTSDPVTTGAHR